MKIIAGNSNKQLSKSIAHHCGQHLCEVELIKFADNELSCMIKENVRGEDVFIIQSTCNPANDHLMELLIISSIIIWTACNIFISLISFHNT